MILLGWIFFPPGDVVEIKPIWMSRGVFSSIDDDGGFGGVLAGMGGGDGTQGARKKDRPPSARETDEQDDRQDGNLDVAKKHGDVRLKERQGFGGNFGFD